MIQRKQTLFVATDKKQPRKPVQKQTNLPSIKDSSVIIQQPKSTPVEEAHKDVQRQTEVNEEKFKDLLKKSEKCLLVISAVFPFDPFPDEVTIDINQVNIIHRIFFYSERRHSIPIQNIKDVFVEASPFFSTLRIVDTGFVEASIDVKFLKKNDAMRARRIIQGLVLAAKEGIDLTLLKEKKMLEKIEELGKIREAE